MSWHGFFSVGLAMVGVLMPSVAWGTDWIADFTSVAPEVWSGSDATAKADYVDTTGNNPNSFTVTFDGAGGLPAGWLTQAERGGVLTTAKFWNGPGAGSGRARFSTLLPLTMDLNQGVAVGWTMRVGAANTTRGPIQIAATASGAGSGGNSDAFNAYIRLRNSGDASGNSYIDIQRNGGGLYKDLTSIENDQHRVDTLVLDRNLTNEFHQWGAAIVYNSADNKAYWKLWLDGELLLFTGPSGSPTLGGEQFSFRTFQESFTGAPYIGLGDLNNQDEWDFEFDCVTLSDDSMVPLTCGIAPSCDSIVTPGGTQASAALRNYPANPASHTYTINNGGTNTLTYNVVEMAKTAPQIASLYETGVDNSRVILGQPVVDPHWTIISGGATGTCSQGAPCSAYTAAVNPGWLANDSNSLWIVADQAGEGIAPPGDHVFRTTFTLADQAAVDAAVINGRMAYDDILMEVKLNGAAVIAGPTGWGGTSWNEFTIDSGFQIGTNTLDFTVRNGGTAPNLMAFRVEFFDIAAGDVPWLALDKSSGQIGEGGSDTVTASIVSTDLPDGTHTAYLGFTDSCDGSAMELRRIDLAIVDCRSAVVPAGNTGRSLLVGSAQSPAPVSYTLQNTGSPSLSYTVTCDASWLQLDKAGGGPIASGGSDTVTGTIDPTGLAAGGHVATLVFTDSCDPSRQHYRQVLLSIDEPISGSEDALQQFNAEFETFSGADLVAESPLESCDPSVSTDRKFAISFNDVASLPSGWLTQGSTGTSGTAKFYNAADGLNGRARFRAFLPFDNTFDPAKGMAVAYRLRIGSGDVIARGPIQITFPRVTGPYGTDNELSLLEGETFNVFIRVQNGTDLRILNNGGGSIGSIDQLTLANTIADQYHQWTAAVCYNAADQMAYWNLWLDGEKLMFGGANGASVGPGGDVYSFRTTLEDVTGDPYIGLGELNIGGDVWDFEFDWVRLLTYDVAGLPFWDGEGCMVLPPCNEPFADSDGDGDVDMEDFAELQRCINHALAVPSFLNEGCRCFDTNNNKVIGDTVDLTDFAACATGAGVEWQPSPGCP